MSFSLAALAMKPQQHGLAQTTGCLVTLHRVCWCLFYCSFTAAGRQPVSVRACRAPSGDSSKLARRKNTILALQWFCSCCCASTFPYLRAWALSCYGLECLRCESHFSCLEKILPSVCVLKGWNHIHTFSGQICGRSGP